MTMNAIVLAVALLSLASGDLPRRRVSPEPPRRKSLQELLEKALGKTKRKVERVKAAYAGNVWSINWAITDMSRANTTQGAAAEDLGKILWEVDQYPVGYTTVFVVGTFPVKSKHGIVLETVVLRAKFSKERLESVKWAEIWRHPEKLLKFADSLKIDERVKQKDEAGSQVLPP